MMRLDTPPRQLERSHRVAVALFHRGGDLRCAHAQAPGGEVEPVEAPRELDDGLVAVAAHVRDDAAHCPIDVLRNLAFAGEKGSKRAVEAGVTGGEMQWHGC